MEMVECSLAATLAPRPLPGRVRNAPSRPAVLAAGRARLRVRSSRREQPPPPETVAVRGGSGTENGGRALGQAAAGLAAAAVVSLTGFAGDVSPLPTLPARAESLTVAFPVAKAREVNRVQRTLVEAWGLIRETFVDPTFNHQGKSVSGLDGEAAAQRLRGRVGTTVKVKLLDGTDNDRGGRIRQKEVQLSREIINLSPLSTTIISHRSDDGHECKTGYIRLTAFSQTAAAEMEKAIKRMEDEGVESYILDLRNNPGGLVKAGLDVAQIWLDGDETLVNTIDREGNVLPINMIQGHSLTHDPLVVLVNEGSASASEILAGALHDNGRAILIGHRTFGKGKIQSVTELDDGSALFITVAKYLSPALHEIDQVGIQPDIQCSPDILSLPRAPQLREDSEATSLEMDSCIMVAEQALEIEQTQGSAS